MKPIDILLLVIVLMICSVIIITISEEARKYSGEVVNEYWETFCKLNPNGSTFAFIDGLPYDVYLECLNGKPFIFLGEVKK